MKRKSKKIRSLKRSGDIATVCVGSRSNDSEIAMTRFDSVERIRKLGAKLPDALSLNDGHHLNLLSEAADAILDSC